MLSVSWNNSGVSMCYVENLGKLLYSEQLLPSEDLFEYKNQNKSENILQKLEPSGENRKTNHTW